MKSEIDFDTLRVPLSKFVLRYVRDPHAAEDLVQETWLRVLRHRHRFQARASLKTWVFSIARNLCLDHLRAAGRNRLRPVEADPVAPEAEDVERHEARARVAAALAGLAPDAREILVLRNYLGLSYRQIARARGVAPTGVGTRLHRAARSLSLRLAE